jgi:putative FmdB family regulatory protein
MPFYDYKCKDCEKVFEIEKGMNEEVHPKCPHCKSSHTVRKFNRVGRMAGISDTMSHEGYESSGSCSSCSSGVCSSCKTKGH